MLLQRLVEYANYLEKENELDLPLHRKKWVRYQIDIDTNGRLLASRPFDLADTQGKQKRGKQRLLPDTVKTVGVVPLLLADNAEYTFGLAREGSKPERVSQCHKAYMSLLEQCVAQTGNQSASAVLNFLRNDPLGKLELSETFDPGGIIIFRVEDRYPHDEPDIRAFWIAHNAPKAGKDNEQMQCIVCGQTKPVLKRLKGKIKGVPGGQPSGTSLISANKPAFESYGLKASHIAPICLECSDRFTKALNHLLSDEKHHVWFRSMVFVFWTAERTTDDWSGWYTEPKPEAVKELIDSVRTGKWNPSVDENPFFSVSLSASGGRTVVRDWVDTTVKEVKKSLARWFQGQAVVSAWGEDPRPLKILALAGSSVRELKDIPSPTYRSLLHTSLTRSPLPWNLMQRAIDRNRAERNVTRPRAALIKLVLFTHNEIKENEMIELQQDHPEPGYHCGRLLAVLEAIQRRAQGKTNTTLVDRSYGTASTAPASVFGRLLKNAQHHLSKLRRGSKRDQRAGDALQKRLEEIVTRLAEISSPVAFPVTLDLKQQGYFALGYYHQRAYDRAQARSRSQQNNSNENENEAES